ncbi:MAG TPA: hypothetical protein DCS93_36070 [Microscillaceae bacterium]|nr:hypothetical protein [Microscillaceae bacterium]
MLWLSGISVQIIKKIRLFHAFFGITTHRKPFRKVASIKVFFVSLNSFHKKIGNFRPRWLAPLSGVVFDSWVFLPM